MLHFENANNNENEEEYDVDDSDDDIDDNEYHDNEPILFNIIYDPEEFSVKKYNIVICSKYNSQLHGTHEPKISDHYLTQYRLKYFDYAIINELVEFVNENTSQYDVDFTVEIAECIYLPSYHCVCIIKTHWLRLIQRKWRNICNERKHVIRLRCILNALRYRESYGKWSSDCINYPVLKGMLSNLSRTSSS